MWSEAIGDSQAEGNFRVPVAAFQCAGPVAIRLPAALPQYGVLSSSPYICGNLT